VLQHPANTCRSIIHRQGAASDWLLPLSFVESPAGPDPEETLTTSLPNDSFAVVAATGVG